MTDRERLLQILNVPIHPHLDVDPLEAVADYLLDNGVTFGAAVPGHENNYDISEMAYNNGYAKGCEDSKQKWIPVSERLPERGQEAIVASYRMIKPVVFTTTFWSKEHDNWYGITHWMPLPNPPEGEYC